MENIKIFMSMPVFNECSRIENWLRRLAEACQGSQCTFVVVNDKSTDDTLETLKKIQNLDIHLLNNETNLGHGASTLRGMRYAVSIMDKDSILITVDGDGHYDAMSVVKMANMLFNSNADVVEGIRIGRNEPGYRRATSQITRLIVFFLSRKHSNDANTPFHAYKLPILKRILDYEFQEDSLIPNIHIAKYLRRNRIAMLQLKVAETPTKGGSPQGTTWKTRYKNFPSKRFLKFCFKATQELFSIAKRKD